MEANSANSTTKASSLRWKILRRSLIRRSSSNSEDKSEMGIQRISRRATHGFNLIPFHPMKDCVEENVNPMDSSWNATLFYTLPDTNASLILQGKRVIELGSGYGLAGLVVAMTTEAQEVFISDGNPQVVDS